MSTGERYTRAGFGVLDVIPRVKAFTTGAKAVGTGSKLLRLGDNILADSKNIGRLAKGTMGEGLQAGKQAMHLRLSNAQKIAQQAGANIQRKLAKDWNDLGAAAKAIQGKAKQAIPLAPRERLALAGAGGSIPEQSAAGASAAATKKKLQEMMQKMDNLNVKGSGKDDIIKGASEANAIFSKSKVESLTKNATHNNSSKSVTLGKWETGEGSYLSVAKKNGDTYFDLGTEGWDEASKLVNGNIDEMWKINKQFLDDQMALGKDFNLSHNPTPGSSTYNGYYQREIEYLKSNGYKIIKNGDYWNAFK
ncbi:hypothetical protein HB796_13745 [Listeria welshimeri]|nr:hypothetical protein [Listeria welshimeri]